MKALASALSLLRGDPKADAVVPPSGATGHLTALATAALAFLTVFALAASLAADRAAARWSGALQGQSTLEVPITAEGREAQAARAERILSQTPGITRAEQLDAEQTRALLSPWIGDPSVLEAIDLPLIFALREAPDFDPAGLTQRLRGELPEAIYHRHEAWSGRIARTAGQVQWLAFTFVAICFGVTAVVVTLAARAALAMHARVIETLRVIGARDTYVARAFVRRFTLRGLTGALIGTALGLAVLAALSNGPELSALSPHGFGEWVLFAIIPLLSAILSFAATRRAAFHVLTRLA
ncbi:cell division protein FtsX [Oceanibium sediminis]|uniref:cell division protein FtsX n=1 Tax=Oceanibium sediminis TaxID=2026339 RepID=UPI000DD4CA8C|nr:FtsX-like permease family protein [Oceanibium sediminis]